MAAPEFRLYNTLTRKIEPFTPEDGKTVRIYTCGPTVYKPAHLGNFRTFLFEDLLRRVIELRGMQRDSQRHAGELLFHGVDFLLIDKTQGVPGIGVFAQKERDS